ncbi:hypothetical protein [Paenibacillus sp. GP183]|uniref:hypothetical protein n=1 Tax=Paenibacillus sp. GP183 TaxID=1882751 RepID=UPI000894D954|nr:hypothetical protein [Paenibacillus sp. GP183]SEC16730.1 hypothetical protein SAMN05443246_3208 [Paenibacillus sp. GP183]
MCVLCGESILQTHWTDQKSAANPSRSRQKERQYRIRLLNQVLAYYGLKVDDWNGAKFVVRDKKGRSEIVHDLGGLWAKAEKLIGRPLNPLDSGLMDFLKRDTV